MSLQLQEDFDDFDPSLLKTFLLWDFIILEIYGIEWAVTDFHIVPVENHIEFVRLREMFV